MIMLTNKVLSGNDFLTETNDRHSQQLIICNCDVE